MAKEVLEMEIKSNTGQVTQDVEKLGKATKKAQGGFRGIGTAVKGVGTALKAAGIGLIVGLLAKLMDVFRENQKTLDFFNTSMTSLSIAFNDLFKFIENNIGAVTGYFKSLFEDPGAKIRELGVTIKEGLVDRFNQFVEVLGLAGKALGQLVTGEFSAAFDTIKEAGRESVDVLTGVDGSIEKIKETVKTAKDAIVDYTKSTIDQAKSITETNKAAEKAAVEFAKLNAQYLKDAEVQRQIRDDETKTFAERIKANEDLNKVLEKQQELQREQLAKQEKAAQLAFDINKSDANYIALQQAKVAVLELEETITGQLSEQKTNQVALERELGEVQNEVLLAGIEGLALELAELERGYELKLEMARKAGVDTAAITDQYEKEKADIINGYQTEEARSIEELAKNQIKWAEMTADEKMNLAATTAGNLSKALGEETAAGKAAAIVQATIDTYKGAQAAFSSMAGIPVVGPVLGGIAAAAAVATGLKNIQAITSAGGGGGGGGGGISAPATAQTQAPAPEMMSGRFELDGAIEPEPVQAYVVSDEVTANQDKLATIRRRATI